MAKVILRDSMSRPEIPEVVYRDGIGTMDSAKKLADNYNEKRQRGSLRMAIAVPDTYEVRDLK